MVKIGILLVILLTLTRMANQICIYQYFIREKLILNKLKKWISSNILTMTLMANYRERTFIS